MNFSLLSPSIQVQGMLNFQKLQNLASIQQQKRAHSPSLVPMPLVGLAAGLTSASCLTSPLNLSLGSSTSNLHTDIGSHNNDCATTSALLGGSSGPCSPQMPQLILASGQLVQGIQGAQLLIPTSQGE